MAAFFGYVTLRDELRRGYDLHVCTHMLQLITVNNFGLLDGIIDRVKRYSL